MKNQDFNPTRCILRESIPLKDTLKAIWKGHHTTQASIVREANEAGIFFTEASLSRYLNGKGNVKNSLTTEHLILLCELYGITLTLKIKRRKK